MAEALIDALDEWPAPAVGVLASPGEPTERMLATIRTLATTFEAHRQSPTCSSRLSSDPDGAQLRAMAGQFANLLWRPTSSTGPAPVS